MSLNQDKHILGSGSMSSRILAFLPRFVIAVYFVLMMKLFLANLSGVSGEARLMYGISEQIYAGATAGRQAVVGSAWRGPVPQLAHFCGFLLSRVMPGSLRVPALVGAAVALLCLCFALYYIILSPILANSANGRGAPAKPLLLTALVLPASFAALFAAPASAVILPLGAMVLLYGAGWFAEGKLRYLVPLAFVMAALTLCGLEAWGWALCGLLLLLLGALRKRELARRLPALLLLGCLPALYAFGVWILLNHLILGDSLFFLRILALLPELRLVSPADWLPSVYERVAAAVCLYGVVRGLATRDSRQFAVGFAGLVGVAWLGALAAWGLQWSGQATRLLVDIAALIVVVRILAPMSRRAPIRAAIVQTALVAALLLPLVIGTRSTTTVIYPASEAAPAALAADAPGEKPEDSGARAATERDATDPYSAVLSGVLAHVEAKSRYSRVFVCGYEGLGLLTAPEGRHRRLEPVLDLHLDYLRSAYRGQRLFLLVSAPFERTALESHLLRLPGIYEHGAPQALHAADFGAWRLYEIIEAPRSPP